MCVYIYTYLYIYIYISVFQASENDVVHWRFPPLPPKKIMTIASK